MREVLGVCTVACMLLGVEAGAQSTTAKLKTPSAPRGWTLLRQLDKMTDAEHLTLVLRSVEGHASLRVQCNDKNAFVVFLTFPKTIRVTDPTLAEVRFDKKESVGYTMMGISHDILIAALGGSKTDANYVFATSDPAKGVRGQFSAEETATTGAALIKEIQGSGRMVYRLSLAEAATGTEGTFNLAGFSHAVAPLTKQCALPSRVDTPQAIQ
jgi:hypothetical protein